MKHIVSHVETYASEIYEEFLKVTTDSLVIEIGSNDGSLLKEFQKFGTNVLGIEPAKNIAKIANDIGIPTKNVFLNYDAARYVNVNLKCTSPLDLSIRFAASQLAPVS